MKHTHIDGADGAAGGTVDAGAGIAYPGEWVTLAGYTGSAARNIAYRDSHKHTHTSHHTPHSAILHTIAVCTMTSDFPNPQKPPN